MAAPQGEHDGFQITAEGIVELARAISFTNLQGTGPSNVPWGKQPSLKDFTEALEKGLHHLPVVYEDAYADPLKARLGRVRTETLKLGDNDPAETLLGAVYNHAPDSGIAAPLRQFLIVISDFYRSFLDKDKRLSMQIPLAEKLPPLATFRHDGAAGLYTYPCDLVHSIIGSEVAVVSMPSVYRNHPILWGALAHETGGHDVLHADPRLLPELRAGIFSLLNNLVPYWGASATFMGMLWSYWADESAADIYGILNLGPAFALNLLSWLTALRAEDGLMPPALLVNPAAAPDGTMDTHPSDLLRIHLAIGGIGSLPLLNPVIRQAYIDVLLRAAEVAAGGAESIVIKGNLPFQNQYTIPVEMELPLSQMQYAAAMVGAYIATAPLVALGGKTIQHLETWTDSDEGIAYGAAEAFNKKAGADQKSDPAHLLAGATLAAVANPGRYQEISVELEKALELAADHDPVWGRHTLRYVIARSTGMRSKKPKSESSMPKATSA